MSLLTDLLLHGAQPASLLRQKLGISQATFSRFVNAESDVVKFGHARATRYMAFAPNSAGSMRQQPTTVQIDPEIPKEIWLEMLPFAQHFWLEVSQNLQISEGFREQALQMTQQLKEVETRIQRLA